jgi:transcriptional regulator with XRE-family HTH domain
MINKNIHTMKQPELGKRISELRKEKGLTQEELVEKCNINVRTIQRIEAGEVNPRSYTIKTILNVLDVDYFNDDAKEKTQFTPSERRKLNSAWIFGIVYFIMGFIETAADLFHVSGNRYDVFGAVYFLIKLISAVSYVFFFIGFYTIAKAYNNQLLKIITILLMTALILINISDVFITPSYDGKIATKLIIECLVFGVLQLIFGAGLLQLKNKLGQLIFVIGILEIIIGASLATVIFAYLGILFFVPTIIIEIILLYKLAKK